MAHGIGIIDTPMLVRSLPVNVDPPYARVFKRLINPYFTPAAVATIEDATRDLVTRMIDEFIERGEVEFMSEFARPFPAQAFFSLSISAPVAQVERVAYLASKSSTPNDPEAAEYWAGLYAWIKDFIASRREEPAHGDVVDAVIAAEVEGRPITEDEMIGTVMLLVLGGLETTAGALGLFFRRFCEEPQIPAYLRAHPERIPDAVEELLRIDGRFIAVGRVAVRDGHLGGCPIGNRDKALLYWASANRDPEIFENPHQFDIDRARNPHMAFGIGPHRCAGSNLARLNLRVALEELLRRLGEFRMPNGYEISYHSTLTRSPHALPLLFVPGTKPDRARLDTAV